MKFVTFKHQGALHFGVLTEAGICDLTAHFPQYASLREVIADGALEQLAESAANSPVSFAEDEIEFHIPIPNLSLIHI